MASWKKVVVSGSTGVELNSLTLKGAAGTIVNQSTVADSKLTGSFTGSFVGTFTNSDGSTVGAQTLQETMALGSTTAIPITSSNTSVMLTGSGTVIAGTVTADDFDVLAAGNVTLFDTVGANNLTIGASTTTVKTTLLESATSVKSDDFDVITEQNITIFDGVGDNDLTIGASTTTVKLVGDLIELGDGTGDVVDIKGSVTNDSTVAATSLTGSFTGSFKGTFTNSDGSSVGSETLQETMELGSTTAIPITSSNTSVMLTGSGAVQAGTVTAQTSVTSADFDVIAAGNATLFDTVGANDLTIGAGTTTVKTTLFESATSVKSDDFDVLTAQDITIFDSVADNILTVGASDTTVKLVGDLIELGNGAGDVVDVKGNLQVAGTASFNHSTNLSVADRYILLSSGSTSANDGGIVVQQQAGGVGQLFAFDSDSDRWGITGSFDADTSAGYTPAAFMAQVVTSDVAAYRKDGNIRVESGEVYIYVE